MAKITHDLCLKCLNFNYWRSVDPSSVIRSSNFDFECHGSVCGKCTACCYYFVSLSGEFSTPMAEQWFNQIHNKEVKK